MEKTRLVVLNTRLPHEQYVEDTCLQLREIDETNAASAIDTSQEYRLLQMSKKGIQL